MTHVFDATVTFWHEAIFGQPSCTVGNFFLGEEDTERAYDIKEVNYGF